MSIILGVATPTVPAAAVRDPVSDLCAANTARGVVPADFTIDACVDGSTIWLRNNLEVPIRFTLSGDTGVAAKAVVDYRMPSMLTRSVFAEPSILMPGDVGKIPVGSGLAQASLDVNSTVVNASGLYVLATTIAEFVPNPVQTVYDAYFDLVKAIHDGFVRYQQCLPGQNFVGQLGCKAELALKVTVAFALDAVKVVLLLHPGSAAVKAAISLILSAATYARFVAASFQSIERIKTTSRTITQAALATPSPNAQSPRPTTTQPKPTNAPPLPTGPDLYLSDVWWCAFVQSSSYQDKNAAIGNFHVAFSGTRPPPGTLIDIRYSYDGGAWRSASTGAPSTPEDWEAHGGVFQAEPLEDHPAQHVDTKLRIKLDYANALTESNESNNLVTIKVTQPAGHATPWPGVNIPCQAQ